MRKLTYRAPVAKIAATPAFLVNGICSLATPTAGSVIIAMSDTTFITALEIMSAVVSTHLPETNGLHRASRGQQPKIKAIIFAK